MKSAHDNFFNFVRDKTKSACDKPVFFFPKFCRQQLKLMAFFHPCVLVIAPSISCPIFTLLKNPKSPFFCNCNYFFDHFLDTVFQPNLS